MAIQHYKGKLGVFDYDDEEFKLVRGTEDSSGFLHYIGKETDGSKIYIPEGIISCSAMFMDCGFLETPPIIPDSVEYCDCMFSDCQKLKTPPTIPSGVNNCNHMFYRCQHLKTPPTIPNSVENCHSMFYDCKSLEIPPVIPDSVKNCLRMFCDCSNEIKKTGEWNIEHRGQSYDNVLAETIEKYGLSDVSKDFDLLMKMSIVDLDDKCKNSNPCYSQILYNIKDGFITDFKSLKQEIEAMDKCIKQMEIDKRSKQVFSEFGNVEQTNNFEQQIGG